MGADASNPSYQGRKLVPEGLNMKLVEVDYGVGIAFTSTVIFPTIRIVCNSSYSSPSSPSSLNHSSSSGSFAVGLSLQSS
jgi:hypothetical protein